MASPINRKRILLPLALLVIAATAGAAAYIEGDEDVNPLDRRVYVSAEDIVWIRPGLKIQIMNYSIPADRRPVTTFRATDDSGQNLDRTGVLTPGAITFRFVLAYIPKNSAQYVDYLVRTATSADGKTTATQATTDSTGTWTSLGDGIYTYKFAATLPADYDTTATHTLCIQATRDLRELGLSRYVVNELVSWVPNGTPIAKIRDIVPSSACNQCHDPVSAHGGGRVKMEYCILCHTPQSADANSGNTANMPVMVHKIHRGSSLPSVIAGRPYYFGTSAAAGANFSTVTYPMDIRRCTSCHKDAQQVNSWLLNPSAAVCGSCHDDVDFKTGKNHPAGAQPTDRDCRVCHWPEGEFEYDASIRNAHIAPYVSSQLTKPVFTFVDVTNTGPSQKPVVKFRIVDKNKQPIAPSLLAGTTGRLALTIAGPTTDYRWYLQEAANTATVGSDGVATYTFTGAIPSDAKGTYTIQSEGYVNVTLNPGTVKSLAYRDAWDNQVRYIRVTGTTTVPRRDVVDLAKCNKCHDKLQLHGNNRNQIAACVLCHNPATTDAARRPAAQNPAETIDMKIMIHKIHTGDELERGYAVYGFGNARIDFGEVRYPGERSNCLQCHIAGTYTVPLPASVTPSTTPRDFWTPMQPTAAACLGCHDSVEAAVHAFVSVSPFGETCALCHAEGKNEAVNKVHAR